MKHKTIVHWIVSVFDKSSATPLPFRNRHLLLDWQSLSETEKSKLDAILVAKRRRTPNIVPADLTTTVMTMSLSNSRNLDRLILPFRRHFKERTLEELQAEYQDKSCDTMSSECFNLIDDYIEDERGMPMTMLDVMDIVAGPGAVLMDDPQSVLRVGPVDPCEPEAWRQQDSETVSQFLSVVQQIWRSDWMQAEVSVTWSGHHGEQSEIVHRIFPSEAEVAAVMGWIRQLYSSDDLFNHACTLYLRQIRSGPKHTWVRHVKDRFNHLRDGQPRFPDLPGITRADLINVFAYGARILHRQSNNDAESALARLLNQHGRENVVMAINGSMRELVGRATLAYHPLRQDFSHWVERKLVPAATSIDLRALLASDRRS